METRYQRYYKLNKEKLRAKRKAYYVSNKAKELERKKSYDAINKEKNIVYNKEYHILNKEKRNAYSRKYHQFHKEEINKRHSDFMKTLEGKLVNRVKRHNRRALIKSLTVEVVQVVYQENIVRFGVLTCELCFKPVKFGDDSLEHFTPLSRGGSNERENLGVAHSVCNSQKGTDTLVEYQKLKLEE